MRRRINTQQLYSLESTPKSTGDDKAEAGKAISQKEQHVPVERTVA
jgi:hypothetical protein